MGVDFAAEFVRQRLAEGDGVAFDDDVQVHERMAEQQIAHDAADEIDVVTLLRGQLADLPDQREQRRGEVVFHTADDVLLHGIGFRERQPDQVRARHHADESALFDDGNLAPASLDHQRAHPFHRILR